MRFLRKLENIGIACVTYSQVSQDDFVIKTLDHKTGGVYVEIGAYHSKDISNTYLLEKDYGWTGVSFELEPDRVEEFNANRVNKCYEADATVFDYKALFDRLGLPKQIDYLQVDIEPAINTLSALLALPLNEYRFSIITFEHDLYADSFNVNVKNKQIEVLSGLGYELVRENVDLGHPDYPFEDWWIDPNIIKLGDSLPFAYKFYVYDN
jgi:hypothetical protein